MNYQINFKIRRVISKYILVLIGFIFSPFGLFFQNMDGKKALRPPAIYSKRIGMVGKAAEKPDEKEKYWLVFSDREDNSYY